MTVNDLLSRLQHVKSTGQGRWIASCPCGQNHSNGDREQSLSVSYNDTSRKILLNCHVGCSLEAICEEIGCAVSDLFNDETRSPVPFAAWYARENNLQFVELYDYCYGEYQDGLAKIRFKDQQGNKTFRWIRSAPETKSGFKMTHDGCAHRLYVAGDLSSADTVFLVEGEKDANSVFTVFKCISVSAENGATKGSSGSKWLPEYTKQLAEKTVFILHDNDDAGRNFARIEAHALFGHAENIMMMDLATVWAECPEKGDISDMIQAFGRDRAKDLFSAMIADAKPFAPEATAPDPVAPAPDPVQQVPGKTVHTVPATEKTQVKETKLSEKDDYKPLTIISASDLNSHEYAKPDYIVDGMLYPGLTIFAGPPKYGKSYLSLDLACSVATGSAFLGRDTKQGNVLYLDLEGTEWRTNERLSQLGYSLCPDLLDHTYEADTVDHHLIRQLTEQIDSKKNPKLLIIDTMARIKGKVRRGENDYSAEYRFLFPLHDLAIKRSVAIVCVTHTRKGGNDMLLDDPMERIHGSTAQYGTADNGWVLTGRREETAKILHCSGRDYENIDLELDFTGGKWIPQGTVEDMEARRAATKYSQDPTVKTIIHLVETSGGVWRGSMQDLINEVAEYTGDYPAADATRMASTVRSYMALLKKRNSIITLVPASARKIDGKSRKEYVFKQTDFSDKNYSITTL